MRRGLPVKGFKNNPEPHWKPVERGQDRAHTVPFPGTGQELGSGVLN